MFNKCLLRFSEIVARVNLAVLKIQTNKIQWLTYEIFRK